MMVKSHFIAAMMSIFSLLSVFLYLGARIRMGKKSFNFEQRLSINTHGWFVVLLSLTYPISF